MVFVKSQNPRHGLCKAQNAVENLENLPGSVQGEPRGNFGLILHPWGARRDSKGNSTSLDSLEDIFSCGDN